MTQHTTPHKKERPAYKLHEQGASVLSDAESSTTDHLQKLQLISKKDIIIIEREIYGEPNPYLNSQKP